MKAYRTPQIPGPPQKQAGEESEEHNSYRAHYILVRVGDEMAQPEQCGHPERRGPEPIPEASVLYVSAETRILQTAQP
jgi:hypothetical protein